LFQNPRTLGRGVDNFNEHGVPQTPYITRIDPPALNLLDHLEDNPLCEGTSTTALPRLDDSCYGAFNMSATSVSSQNHNNSNLSHSAQLVLVRGGASFCGAHVTLRLLQGGYNVRILASDCTTTITQLMDLVKSRLPPQAQNRLLIFRGTELTDALEGCDFVVCNTEPETGDLTSSSDIKRRFLDDMQDLFLSIHSVCRLSQQKSVSGGNSGNGMSTDSSPASSVTNMSTSTNHPVGGGGRKPPRIIWITTAATVFPVETTSQARSRHLIEAKTAALKEAERIARKADIPFVVLLPSVMVGSGITEARDDAHYLLSHLAKGNRWFPFAPSLTWNFVDVQDVADAVFLAMTSEAAVHQRFLLSDCELSIAEIGRLLAGRFPMLSPATIELPNILTLMILSCFGLLGEGVSFRYLQSNLGRRYPLENQKARRTLGIKFHRATEAIVTSVSEMLGITPVVMAPSEASNTSLSTSSSQASLTGDAKFHHAGNAHADHSGGSVRRSRSDRKRPTAQQSWLRPFGIPWLCCVASVSLGCGILAGALSKRN
jgi:nucleoside-diphosphate-sugar epimerase